MKPNIPKLIFAILAAIYFLLIAYRPMEGSFLDMVDLPIHETGHLLFRLFGEFMMAAGGSLFQVIVPVVFAGYFFHTEKYYSAAFALFWVGQSILNVYVYAQDAAVMQLVLTNGSTGSEGSFHDWNYLLTETGLIGFTKQVAGLIRATGTLIILAAAGLTIWLSFAEQAADLGEG
jgi:hypothetical protein